MSDEKPVILVVDDNASNLKLIGHSLSKQHLSLSMASGGEEALSWLENEKPDLILLDISMPEMDGIECCRRLKQIPKLKNVPVLFLSARTDEEAIDDGFRAGGVDYITKPFNHGELIARVRTHLGIKAMRDDLRNRLKQREELIQILAHDIRSPLGTVKGLAEFIKEDLAFLEESKTRQTVFEYLDDIIALSAKTSRNLDALLKSRLHNMGDIDIQEIALGDVIDSVFLRNELRAIKKAITLSVADFAGVTVMASDVLLEEVLDNLVSNAIKFAPKGTTVSIDVVRNEEGEPQLRVRDEGPGFSERDITQMYQPFQPLSAKPTGDETSCGIGLSIVREFMHSMHGKVYLESAAGESASFLLSFCSPGSRARLKP